MHAIYRGLLCGIVAAELFVGTALAEDKDPAALLELGAAGSWDAPGGSSFGPSAAIEFAPIKNYLVVEAGLTQLFDKGRHADWDFDVLFRHPFDLPKNVEFEPGVGPTWSSTGQPGVAVSFEFMIWPSDERKFGWFVDPSVSFAGGHQQSFGIATGLIVGIPGR